MQMRVWLRQAVTGLAKWPVKNISLSGIILLVGLKQFYSNPRIHHFNMAHLQDLNTFREIKAHTAAAVLVWIKHLLPLFSVTSILSSSWCMTMWKTEGQKNNLRHTRMGNLGMWAKLIWVMVYLSGVNVAFSLPLADARGSLRAPPHTINPLAGPLGWENGE